MTSRRDKTYRNDDQLRSSRKDGSSGFPGPSATTGPSRSPVDFGRAIPDAPSRPSAPRAREGPDVSRPSSPAWDLTAIKVRREDKARFDLLRVSRSWDGRVRPHWEVFAEMLDEAENT